MEIGIAIIVVCVIAIAGLFTRFDGYAMLDAIEFGAQWQFEKVNEALLSEVLPYFMHGGEADEVVAKLDEVLNQKK